jgi:hypothetical protein
MPPQQFQRLLDFGGDGGDLGAHLGLLFSGRTLAFRSIRARRMRSHVQHRRNRGD